MEGAAGGADVVNDADGGRETIPLPLPAGNGSWDNKDNGFSKIPTTGIFVTNPPRRFPNEPKLLSMVMGESVDGLRQMNLAKSMI